MKHIKYYVLLFAVFATLAFTSGIQNDCRVLYEKILQLNTTDETQLYQKFTSQSFLGETAGYKATTEVWIDGKSAIFSNDLVTMFHKGNQQLLIMHNNNKIILKNAEKEEESGASAPNLRFSYDTLVKYAKVNCSASDLTQLLTINLPKQVSGNENSIKRIEYKLKNEPFEVKKMVIEYYGDEMQKDIYEYLVRSEKVNNPALNKSLEDYIYSKGKTLKPDFKGYQVQDIRTTDFLKDRQ